MATLLPDDLERMAMSARLLGRDDESHDLLTRAHSEFLRQGQIERAARSAAWLAFHLQTRGEVAQGSGWVARGRRLLEDAGCDCAELGLLLISDAMRSFFAGDPPAALPLFIQATRIGERFGDRHLITMARHGQGRCLLRLGRRAEGIGLLDEVMVSVTAGEVMPFMVGEVYCSMLEACHEVYDLRRAQEWTTAFDRWCASQPDQLPYRGACLIHRAQVLQLHGEWGDAMQQARLACDALARTPGHFATGSAHYQIAELHRLRGEFSEAEAAYREAGQSGRAPQPGLAQLRLAQGQIEAARQAICNALDGAPTTKRRSELLAVCVDVRLAAREVAVARAGAEDLLAIADELDAPFLRAAASRALGAVLLAEGEARPALTQLRDSWGGWRSLNAPYEAARTGVLIAAACEALGDRDGGAMELEAARRVFEALGAQSDLAQLKRQAPTRPPSTGGLTSREMQVLRLIATGRTNRGIAGALGISERTVARHVSNIFTKLGLSSRAAATAYAYHQQLVIAPT